MHPSASELDSDITLDLPLYGDNNNISPPHAQIQTTINQEVVVGVEPQAIMGSLGKEASQRRSFCIKQTPLNLQDYTCIVTMDEPLTISKALEREDGSLWKQATNEEYNSLLKNGTWILIKLPKGKYAIGSKWVFRIKHKLNDKMD